jgi:hypothetical protein
MLSVHSFQDPPLLKFLEGNGLMNVEEELIAALHTRIERGEKPPLHDIPMEELLQRFWRLPLL